MNLLYFSDRVAQTDGYHWASWRVAYNLRDALILIILGGDKALFSEITEAHLPIPSMNRLSLTAASYHASDISDKSPYPVL